MTLATAGLVLPILAGALCSDEPSQKGLLRALEIYSRYELPLPAQDSELIAFPSRSIKTYKGNDRKIFQLVFRQPSGDPKYFRNPGDKPIDYSLVDQFPPVDIESLMRTVGDYEGPVGYSYTSRSSLVFTMQLAYIGEMELAQRYGRFSSGLQDADEGLISSTYEHAARTYITRYGYADQSTETVVSRLKEMRSRWLDNDNPNSVQLQIDGILDAALPSDAMEGSDVWLIDQLVLMAGDRGGTSVLDYQAPQVQAIFARGPGIIPELLNHLLDQRTVRVRDWDSRMRYGTVGQVCDQILGDWMGSAFNWGTRQLSQTPHEWWESNRGKSEQEILKAAIFPRDHINYFLAETEGKRALNGLQVQLFEQKFPEATPDLYRETLLAKDYENASLASVIANSNRSSREIAEILGSAATSGHAVNKLIAARRLVDHDPRLAEEILRIVMAGELPDDPVYRRARISLETMIAYRLENQALAQLMLSRIAREEVGARIAALGALYRVSLSREHRNLAIAGIESMLIDATMFSPDIQNLPKSSAEGDYVLSVGTYQCSEFENPMRVGDYAALCLALTLRMKEKPAFDWKEKDWERYRPAVLKALSQHRQKPSLNLDVASVADRDGGLLACLDNRLSRTGAGG
jgi:hypothetical protein